ncbi:hypothetical protein ABNF65_08085 [Paenibacillus larvae]
MEQATKYCFHPVHRRLAELYIKYGSLIKIYKNCSLGELHELEESLKQNANLVRKLDELKNLAFLAYEMNDMDWLHEICSKIEKLEASFLI